MKIIGDQRPGTQHRDGRIEYYSDDKPSIIYWLQNCSAEEGSINGFPIMSFRIETSCTKNLMPTTLKKSFDALPVANPYLKSKFDVHALSMQILKDSRRGKGNQLLCPSMDVIRRIDGYEKLVDMGIEITETASLKGHVCVLAYVGMGKDGKVIRFDTPFVSTGTKLYANETLAQRVKKFVVA